MESMKKRTLVGTIFGSDIVIFSSKINCQKYILTHFAILFIDLDQI